MRIPFIIAATAVLVCGPVGAQEATREYPHRFSVTGLLGVVAGRNGTALNDQFELGGYGPHTVRGGCSVLFIFSYCEPDRSYPVIQNRGSSSTLAARYDVNSRWAVAAGAESAELGGAEVAEQVSSVWRDSAKWLLALYKPREAVRLGVGLSLHELREVSTGGSFREIERATATRPGLTLEAGVSRNLGSHFFWDTALRGHIIPGADVPRAELVLRPWWSHVTLQTGLGLRVEWR